MENIKVSVIIPVYNTEKYLEEAVNSIINQTLREIEIIIVNDGSTDNSIQILENFAKLDNRIIILTHEKNKGLSEARNTGIKEIRGEYIYFFDSDDILETDCLELCYNKSSTENLDFLFFDAVTFYDNTDKTNLKLNYQRSKGLESKVYKGIEIFEILLKEKRYKDPVWLNFIKTSYLKQLNLSFIPGIYHEDILFSLQLYVEAKRVDFICRSFFHRRMRGNSIMGKLKIKNIDDMLFIVREIKKYKTTTNDIKIKKLLNKKIRTILLFLSKKLLSFDVKIIFTRGIKIVKLYVFSL